MYQTEALFAHGKLQRQVADRQPPILLKNYGQLLKTTANQSHSAFQSALAVSPSPFDFKLSLLSHVCSDATAEPWLESQRTRHKVYCVLRIRKNISVSSGDSRCRISSGWRGVSIYSLQGKEYLQSADVFGVHSLKHIN